MNKYDFSILIPARNEEFLARTVEDILKNKRGNTEILIGLDGKWADPGIPDHKDVTIVYYPQSIGQRAMTNQLCRLSRAKYVMKVDAHCAFDEGFDVKIMADMQDNYTLVPTMYNLWAFDWNCKSCGHRVFQNPIPQSCENCGGEVERLMIWKPNPKRPTNTAYCFDSEPHFQYFSAYKERQVGDLVETMSIQGSCFVLTREKYWQFNICDEELGSWGSQGIEVACKTWLSGGEVRVSRKTWYAHLFRTGDFHFPYPTPTESMRIAKIKTRELFFENKWPQQVRPISWLLEKFWPITGKHKDGREFWSQADLDNIKAFDSRVKKKGIIYYTDNRLDEQIAQMCRQQLLKVNIPIVSVSLQPIAFGKNIHLPLERGIETYFKQIITALENSDAEVIYFCEHDVMYHPSHFEFTPPSLDKFYYNHNWWKIRVENDFAVHWDADQVSGLVCYRELALEHYKNVLANFQRETFNRKYEPGSGINSESFLSREPLVDIRVSTALTKSKWSLGDFRDKSTAKNFQEGAIPVWAKNDIISLRKTLK